jgi:quercetin dioxygenase-like cupin family protein
MNKIDLSEIPVKELITGYFVRFVHSVHMTLAYWRIEAGAPMPEHSHPNEQVTTIIEGEFVLNINNENIKLREGNVFIIPPDILHSGKAITKCWILDAFHPLREDYK